MAEPTDFDRAALNAIGRLLSWLNNFLQRRRVQTISFEIDTTNSIGRTGNDGGKNKE